MLNAPCRVAVVSDFVEENWPSMDLVADMLVAYLARNHSSEIAVTQLRPPMRRLFSRLGTRTAWNADRFLNRFYYYPRWLRKRRNEFDLFHIVDHSYAHLALELAPERTLITCHDLDAFLSLLAPGASSSPAWFRRFTRRILAGFQRASHIVCNTRSTQAAVLSHKLVPAGRISVNYFGVDKSFLEENASAAAEVALLLPELPGGRIWLLSVGSTIPRKRMDVLLRVFAAVHPRHPTAKLVRVGGPFTPPQAQLVSELGLTDSIVVLPFLDSKLLAAVYQRATLLLQTSEAEGFGLPLIEAMACGCPVVASDIPALREIGGPATTLCPVADVDVWVGEILKLLDERNDSSGAWRERKKASTTWASQFTWPEYARRTVELYRRLIESQRMQLQEP